MLTFTWTRFEILWKISRQSQLTYYGWSCHCFLSRNIKSTKEFPFAWTLSIAIILFFRIRFLDFCYREKVCLKCVCKKRRKSFPQTRVPFKKLEKGFEADNGRSKRGGFAGAKWKRSGTRAISRGSTCTLQGIGIDRWKWGGGAACNAHRRGSPSAAKALCNIQLPKYQLAESGADSSDREKRLSSSASVLPRCLWEIRWQLHLSTVHSPQSFPDNSWPTTCTRSIHTSDICMYLRKNSFSPFLLSFSLQSWIGSHSSLLNLWRISYVRFRWIISKERWKYLERDHVFLEIFFLTRIRDERKPDFFTTCFNREFKSKCC